MEGQITLDVWNHWNMEIKEKLAETAENFVYIGYRLRQIRDSGMYGGFDNVYAFARNEFGLGRSTVSRFIAINEKFSEGGNSLKIKSEYRGLSQSKLTEMLTLTDEECELITEQTTVSEIRELKQIDKMEPEPVAEPEQVREEPQEAVEPEEIREEAQEAVEPEETPKTAEPEGATEAMEPAEAAGAEEDDKGFVDMESLKDEETVPVMEAEPPKLSAFEKCIADFFKDKKELLNQAAVEAMQGDEAANKRLAELLNPSGYRTHSKGIVFMFMYGIERGVAFKQAGMPTPQSMTWEEFAGHIREVFGFAYEKDRWNTWEAAAPAYYGKELGAREKDQEKERREVEAAFVQEKTESVQKEPDNALKEHETVQKVRETLQNESDEVQGTREDAQNGCDAAQESAEDQEQEAIDSDDGQLERREKEKKAEAEFEELSEDMKEPREERNWALIAGSARILAELAEELWKGC